MTSGDHIAERRLKALRSFFSLGNIGLRSPQLKMSIKSDLYKTCCRPILTYGIENLSITQTDSKKVKRAEGNIIKNMFSITKYARTTPLLESRTDRGPHTKVEARTLYPPNPEQVHVVSDREGARDARRHEMAYKVADQRRDYSHRSPALCSESNGNPRRTARL